MKTKSKRCEGWRRYGGMFTLGPVTWRQCERDATVMLTVKQDGKTKTMPACAICWNEAMETGIEVLGVKPLTADAKKTWSEMAKGPQ